MRRGGSAPFALYGRGVADTREPQSHRPVDGTDDAATKAADVVAHALAGRRLNRREKQIGAPIVHYAFGASMGALYGLLYALRPDAARQSGLLFGSLVWLGADEIALPLAGLADGPRAYPAAVHTEMLGAHLVYGYTTDVVMRWMESRVRLWPDRGANLTTGLTRNYQGRAAHAAV